MSVAVLQEVVPVDEHYTYAQAERMARRYLGREDADMQVHGRITARAARLAVCPRCMDMPDDRKTCRHCNRKGKVTDIGAGGGQGPPSVSDAVLDRVVFWQAYRKLPEWHRRTLLLYYGTGWSVEKIVAWQRERERKERAARRSERARQPTYNRMTLWRHRKAAIEALVRALNGGG